MAIFKTENLNFEAKHIHMVLSGMPGVGKTTLALSAPNVLLFDFDNGIARVKAEHRKDVSINKNYEEFLEDIEQVKGKYETIVIDTVGEQIETMKEWAMRTDPKARKTSGGISIQGFGIVKSEHLQILSEIRNNFNTIEIFHTTKEKINDDVFYDVVCEGSAKNAVWTSADLGAYLQIMNGKRYLGFSPTANYNAKSSYGISGLIEVPELKAGEPNVFLTKLFEQVRKYLADEAEMLKSEKKKYDEIMKNGMAIVGSVKAPEDIKKTVDEIEALPTALTSKAELKNALKSRMDVLGIKYNKTTKEYEYDAKQE